MNYKMRDSAFTWIIIFIQVYYLYLFISHYKKLSQRARMGGLLARVSERNKYKLITLEDKPVSRKAVLISNQPIDLDL